MNRPHLEFQGVASAELLMVLLGGICAMLVIYGAWRLMRRRWRDGLISLLAVVPPLAGAALLVSGVRRRSAGRAVEARGDLLAGGVILLASAGVTALFFGSGGVNFAVWMAVLALEIAVAVGVFYAAVYAYLGTHRLVALMTLRCAAILALLLLLFKPVMSVPPDIEGQQPLLPILVDRSASMGAQDAAGSASRYRQVVHMLGAQRGRIDRGFRPVWMHFGESARAVEDWTELSRLGPDADAGAATDLASAIRSAAAFGDRRDVTGVLVLTDGVHNAAASDLEAAVVEAGVPIYAIGVGSKNEGQAGRRNFEILSADAPFEVVRNNVSRVTVQVRAVGFPNMAGELRLLAEGSDTPLATEPIWTDKNAAVLKKELRWTPKTPPSTEADEAAEQGAGEAIQRLRVVVAPNPAETVAEDNAAQLHVLVTEPRVRVLYVEGTVRPEYKFLWRTLNTDQNVQLMSLIRFQDNRFSAYGRIGDRRLTALPRTKEDFELFDVIVLGDLDSTFLTGEQMNRMRQFVKEGGALVMLGGHNSFGPGGYAGTPVEDVLPVLVGPRSQPQETAEFLPQLTAFGVKHPIFSGLARYFRGPDGREPTDVDVELPPLRGCVAVLRAKPAATVLAVHPERGNDAGPLIVLAVQSYGAGRSAAFTADTTWQWFLPLRAMGVQSPYRLFWGQLVRWLADVEGGSNKAGASVVARTDRSYLRLGEDLEISARIKDATGQPTSTARVTAAIESVESPGVPENRPLTPTQTDGVYRAVWRPSEQGTYRLRVAADSAANLGLGQDDLTVIVAPRSTELERLARDEKALGLMGQRSGGVYADISALPEVLDQILQRRREEGAVAARPDTYPLYNFTALFVVFVGLLAGEWLLRRSWQLQ